MRFKKTIKEKILKNDIFKTGINHPEKYSSKNTIEKEKVFSTMI